MLQKDTNHKRAAVIEEKDRRDDVSGTACEDAASEDTPVDHDLLSIWTLDEYHHEYAVVMDVKRLDAMGVAGRNPVFCDQNHIEHDTAFGEWKRC